MEADAGRQTFGLTSAEAARRLDEVGPNVLGGSARRSGLGVLVAQLRNPLLLLLLFAATVSALTGEWIDAAIVTTIVVASVGLSFSREVRAESAAAALRARIRARATVVRDGRTTTIPTEEVVPGDLFLLAAGALVPADGLILEATDLYVSEAALTGESFPVEKRPGQLPAGTPLARRTNSVFLGTNVRSGSARCLAVETGARTQFGAIAKRLTTRPPLTEFDRGIRRFGELLTIAMLVMVLLVFVAHMLRARPVVETLLFAIALAVGLSPELMPAILAVNLARGATLMARGGVLVRRLNAIENLGSMDVLCIDKTGTITEGVVRLDGAFDASGAPSSEVLSLAALNAAIETGLPNPLDDAILAALEAPTAGVRKIAEIPFDFTRKRVSVVVVEGDHALLVTKGAFHHVLDACSLDAGERDALEGRYQELSARGVRVLAVATRTLEAAGPFGRQCEHSLTFRGLLTFLDREKATVAQAIRDLAALGVAVKVITGDARAVAQHVAARVGLHADRVLDGAALDDLQDDALFHDAERTDLFVEVDPNQKERIIAALRRSGHVVGFLGDGVNDAPAMHAADTSLSVESAVDVAREAADFVLLEPDLDVIRRGIVEGRRTFANTLKYILMATSANLGNMMSMAVASLFLSFLPLTAGQILLNNFLSDVPAIGIADDSVDPELVARPRRWELRFIARFMIEFGLLSSVFDLLTFTVLIWGFHAAPSLFRTTWFVESLLSELVIVLVVRTRRPFYRSRPGDLLLSLTMVLIAVALALPYLPLVGVLGFVPLPAVAVGAVVGITLLYVTCAELLKRWFYRERANTATSSARLPTLSLSNSAAS